MKQTNDCISVQTASKRVSGGVAGADIQVVFGGGTGRRHQPAAAVVVGQQRHTPRHPGPAAGGCSHPGPHCPAAHLVGPPSLVSLLSLCGPPSLVSLLSLCGPPSLVSCHCVACLPLSPSCHCVACLPLSPSCHCVAPLPLSLSLFLSLKPI